jgi:hypothetical protein
MIMTAPSLNLIVLRAANPGLLASFYTNLGFQFEVEKHGSGPEHLASNAGGSTFEIYPKTTADSDTTAVRLGFRVGSISQILGDLGDKVDVISSPSRSEWGMRCVLRDPEGHKVELVE